MGPVWTRHRVSGGQGHPLEVWRLHRSPSSGVVVFLHGFGDDAWGTLPQAASLPDWDAVGFTFRGRDRDPSIPCTLGGWERQDVAAVVRWLESQGTPRSRIVLAAWSMGAGVALLALSDLEREGGPLGGALLECPYQDLRAAARDHIRGALHRWELLTRVAQRVALARLPDLAGVDPEAVNPAAAAQGLRTPMAFVTGDADRITPAPGVRIIAGATADVTVVQGAGHCEASSRLPGGWAGWVRPRLQRWGLTGTASSPRHPDPPPPVPASGG